MRRLFRLVNGGTPTANPENWGGDVPWATPVDLAKVDGRILKSTERTLTKQGLRTGSRLVGAGALILSTRAPIGYVAETARPTAFNQGCRGLEPIEPMDVRFFRYQLGAASDRLAAMGQGSTFIELAGEALAAFPVSAPPLDEQRTIADYLDRETARIELLVADRNAQMTRLRERRAAVLQHVIDDARSVEMPLRRVVRRFVDYRGATPTKADTGVPLVTATNISDGRIDFSLGEEFVTEETYRAWMRRGFPEEGDVLLTTEAPLGEVAAITDSRVALAQRLILLKPNERVTPEYLRLVLMSSRVRADLLSRASGSTVWGIRADRLRDVRLPVTDLRAQGDIVVLMTEIENHLASAQALLSRQLGLLAERRQALITAAVMGHLTVSVPA